MATSYILRALTLNAFLPGLHRIMHQIGSEVEGKREAPLICRDLEARKIPASLTLLMIIPILLLIKITCLVDILKGPKTVSRQPLTSLQSINLTLTLIRSHVDNCITAMEPTN